jgi:uncharacterized DUF497 family protein
MINYNFEWDCQKAEANITKHGISFEESATVFQDPMAVSIYDDDHSTNEERWITLGISITGKLLLLCHTFQKESDNAVTIRIFSSRKATKHEIKQYEG